MHRPGLELTRLTPQQRRRPALRRRDVGPAGPRGARRLRRRSCGTRASRSTCSATCSRRRSTSPGPGSSSRTSSPPPPGSGRRWTSRWTSWSAAPPADRLAELLIGGVLKRDLRPARDLQPAAGVPRRRRLPARPAAEPPVPAGQLGLGLRRAVGQPDEQAGPQAGDDQLPAGLQLPPDVPRRRPAALLLRQRQRAPRPGQLRGRRHPGHRQRRGDDRHGRADHARRASSSSPGSTSRTASVTKVIAVELPKTRAFMHLDTAMTMIDRDAFSVYPYLPDDAAVVHPHAGRHRRRLPGHRERRAVPGRRRGPRGREAARAAHADRRARRPARAVGRRQQLPGRRARA